MSRELEYRYEGYRIKGRRPYGLDDQLRAWGEVDVVGWDEEAGQPKDWEATIKYVVDVSDVRFLEVTVKPTGDDMTSTIWKKVLLGDVRAYLRDTFANREELASMPLLLSEAGAEFNEEEQAVVDEQRRRAEAAAKVLRESKPVRGAKKSKRRKLNDQHWRSITDAYNFALRTGGRRGIYRRMADFINEEEEDAWTGDDMRWMTERARQYEFLPRPGHGSTGGGYGPKYIETEEQQK